MTTTVVDVPVCAPADVAITIILDKHSYAIGEPVVVTTTAQCFRSRLPPLSRAVEI
jgi:hypothetical protein